jgi:transposase-like protein
MFRRRHFTDEIILLCVRWYVTYKLFYRDLSEMMFERGIQVAPSTICRWVQRYIPEFEKRWDRFSRPVGTLVEG